MVTALGLGPLWLDAGLRTDIPGKTIAPARPAFLNGKTIHFLHPLIRTRWTTAWRISASPCKPDPCSNLENQKWQESVFGDEILTAILGPGEAEITNLTIAAMEDLGTRQRMCRHVLSRDPYCDASRGGSD